MKARLAPLVAFVLLTSCSSRGQLDETGGVYVVRSVCPQVSMPAGTNQVTLFDLAGRTDPGAVDVVATITRARGQCSEDATTVVSTATFEVVATRRDSAAARQLVLPTFGVSMQGGTTVAAKRVSGVALNFAAGSNRAETVGTSTVRVSRSAATLPEDVRRELTRRRRPGDADAAVDPLIDPKIRQAVAQATFEHLVGFQLTDAQLRYNSVR